MDPIQNLATERVKKLTPYMSARRIGGQGHTFLNANESPKSSRFLMNSLRLNRYPECQPEEVIETYADYAGITKDQILVGRGSDECIGLLIRTFCEPGKDSILICPPTYGMYKVSADTNGVEAVEVPPKEDYSTDTDAVIETLNTNKDIKIVFLCSPNNPTGGTVAESDLRKILDAAADKALVVVDEAYIEFCYEKTLINLRKEYRGLVITRTLSKAFALAGIRCGFTIADPEVIKMMLKVIDPYPISDPVAQIAIQALSSNGISIMQDRVKEINERKTAFVQEMKALPFVKEVFNTNGNYILFRFTDGEKMFNAFARRGIILRDFNDKPRLKDCVRITIGSAEEMKEVMNFFKTFA